MQSVDVSFKKICDTLSLHHHYDHTIDLQPTFVPQITKIYLLDQAEIKTNKKFTEKHLKIG